MTSFTVNFSHTSFFHPLPETWEFEWLFQEWPLLQYTQPHCYRLGPDHDMIQNLQGAESDISSKIVVKQPERSVSATNKIKRTNQLKCHYDLLHSSTNVWCPDKALIDCYVKSTVIS